jgi:hypothetical protein
MEVLIKILGSLWEDLRDVFLQWIYPFAIFKKMNGVPIPIFDKEGNPVVDINGNPVFAINWVATVVARVLSFVTVAWGTVELLGIPVSEWVVRITQTLGFI